MLLYYCLSLIITLINNKCVVEYEKGSAHRKYVLRKLQNKQKSGSPYECRFFALLH